MVSFLLECNLDTDFISGGVAFVLLPLESTRPWKFSRRLKVFIMTVSTQDKQPLKTQLAGCCNQADLATSNALMT